MTSMRRPFPIFFLLIAAVLLATGLFAQDKDKPEPEARKPLYVSPTARLTAAKTAFIRNLAGSEVPYNVINGGLEAWGRFRLVDSPAQADILIEVLSPDGDTSSVSTKSRTGISGRTQDSTSSPSASYQGPIKFTVSDARTHLTLWSSSEQAKGAFRQRTREENLVEAAARLLTRFRERVEPLPPAPPPPK